MTTAAPEFTGFEATAPAAAPAAPSALAATEPQIRYLDDLLRRKNLTPDQRIWVENQREGLTKARASQILDRLVLVEDKPREQRQAAPQPTVDGVPDGYYALEGLEGFKNDVNFFRLNTGKHGRWEGFQFIDHYVAGGHDHPIKGEGRKKVYEAIKAQGINEARERFGRELGRCGVCGRELTDDTSRALGIGPVCREGW